MIIIIEHPNSMKIIISLPLVWSVRNFILSGVTEELSKRYEIFYAVECSARPMLTAYNIPDEKIIEIKKGKKFRVLSEILRTAFLIKNPEFSYLTDAMKKGGITKVNNSIKSQLKKLLLTGLAHMLNRIHLFKFTESCWLYLSFMFADRSFSKKIKDINPTLILTTTFVVDIEWPLIFVAKGMKLPIYTHVLSFDNITSRGYLPISRFNRYFVWNKKMKDELIYYYNINENIIDITGTPQFDFHTNTAFILGRADALELLNLSPNFKFILYCANHVLISPNEPDLLDDIITYFCEDDELKKYKILLRLHPMDDYSRWDQLLKKYTEKIQLSIPWEHPVESKNAIGIVTNGDMVIFVNQLKHAEIILNIASTITIDSAVVNTPVICIGFHTRNSRESKCYLDYHYSVHYSPIMNTGCVPLAKSLKELHELVKDVISEPSEYNPGLANIKDFFIGNINESAKDLILKSLLN